MKKYKLILTSCLLALTLMFAPAHSLKVYAEEGDPQGTSNTAKAPPPAPENDVVGIVSRVFRWLFGGR